MSFFKTVFSILTGANTAHTKLPPEFETSEFVGAVVRDLAAPGYIDDRVRDVNGIVEYAPRKILPDLKGDGTEVSENYPQSTVASSNPDSTEANVPRQARGIVFDTLTEIHEEQDTFAVAGGGTATQPASPFNARYPYNHVRETESGHLFEADDTPGAERIKESHRMGTYYEVFPDGSKVTKVVGNNYVVIVGDDSVHVRGGVNLTVEGDCNLSVNGNMTMEVGGTTDITSVGVLSIIAPNVKTNA